MNDSKIERYLKLAKNACYYSDCDRARVGCILVYHNYVLSVGWNLESKTNPLQKKYNHLRGYNPDAPKQQNHIHAEMMAMSKVKSLDIDWSKVSMFVYRILKNDSKGLAKPCPACEGFARVLGIHDFYYTTSTGWIYEKIM